jgi:hypothetical protein
LSLTSFLPISEIIHTLFLILENQNIFKSVQYYIPYIFLQRNKQTTLAFIHTQFRQLLIRERSLFMVPKILLTQPLKNQKFDYPISSHPWPKLQKDVRQVVTHVLYHFCDTSLIMFGLWNLLTFLQSKVSCCLRIYFLWRHHLVPTNRKMIEIATLTDSHIVLTYDCWHCFLVFNIWMSHALEMTINFYYPTFELFRFSFTQPFILTQNFVWAGF